MGYRLKPAGFIAVLFFNENKNPKLLNIFTSYDNFPFSLLGGQEDGGGGGKGQLKPSTYENVMYKEAYVCQLKTESKFCLRSHTY